jgi:magnesium transporter
MAPDKRISSTVNRKRLNNLLYGSLTYNGSYEQATEIHLTSYDAKTCQTELIKHPKDLKFQKGKINWVHVCGLSDTESVGELCRMMGLELPVVQDILNARHISKLEDTGSGLFAVLDAYSYNESSILIREHQSLVLGPDVVLSFDEGTGNRFEQVRKVLMEGIGQLRKHQADFLFNLLISLVVDSYFDVIEKQQNRLLDLEDLLMEFQTAHKETGQQIQLFRRDYSRLKKGIAPLREDFGRLLMIESTFIQETSRLYFRDTYDHLQQVMTMLEANREAIASLVDLYLANNNLRLNRTMSQLTIVATIFIPLTFLVGVWGMNFRHMPELDWVDGYLYAWLILIAVGVGLYVWFKRKNLF